jgi:hypothetical protein
LRLAGTQPQAKQGDKKPEKTKQKHVHTAHVNQALKMRRMKVFPRHWADCNTTDFAELDLQQAVAVLPLGATEQHGPHLPLSVDTDLVEGVVQASLVHLPAALSVLFLPTQTVGLSPEHARFPGTLTLRAETVIRMWTEIGESVAASGIRKLLLLNAHGGQVGPGSARREAQPLCCPPPLRRAASASRRQPRAPRSCHRRRLQVRAASRPASGRANW